MWQNFRCPCHMRAQRSAVDAAYIGNDSHCLLCVCNSTSNRLERCYRRPDLIAAPLRQPLRSFLCCCMSRLLQCLTLKMQDPQMLQTVAIGNFSGASLDLTLAFTGILYAGGPAARQLTIEQAQCRMVLLIYRTHTKR